MIQNHTKLKPCCWICCDKALPVLISGEDSCAGGFGRESPANGGDSELSPRHPVQPCPGSHVCLPTTLHPLQSSGTGQGQCTHQPCVPTPTSMLCIPVPMPWIPLEKLRRSRGVVDDRNHDLERVMDDHSCSFQWLMPCSSLWPRVDGNASVVSWSLVLAPEIWRANRLSCSQHMGEWTQ